MITVRSLYQRVDSLNHRIGAPLFRLIGGQYVRYLLMRLEPEVEDARYQAMVEVLSDMPTVVQFGNLKDLRSRLPSMLDEVERYLTRVDRLTVFL